MIIIDSAGVVLAPSVAVAVAALAGSAVAAAF